MLNKVRFYTINLKKNFFAISLCLFILCLLVFSKNNITAAKSGLQLWANSVVPSLFPFFVAIELLNYTNVANILGKFFNKIMRPLFNVPGEGSYAFIMGLISGYPTGAKIVTQFRNNGIVTKAEAERLLTFTNNSGSLFILGTVGVALFGNTTIGILLLITHVLACISVGMIFRFWKFNDREDTLLNKSYTNNPSSKNMLSSSISNAINTTLMIGGFVVLFSIVISILKSSNLMVFLSNLIIPITNVFNIDTRFCIPILSGIIELTNGVSLVSDISTKLISSNIIISAFLLGFGGISVVLQIYAIIADSDISIFPYILGKLLQGIFASIYTFIFIKIFPFFNFNLVPIFSNSIDNLGYNAFYDYNYIITFIFFMLAFFIIIVNLHHHCNSNE